MKSGFISTAVLACLSATPALSQISQQAVSGTDLLQSETAGTDLNFACRRRGREYTITFSPEQKTVIAQVGQIRQAYTVETIQSRPSTYIVTGHLPDEGPHFSANFEIRQTGRSSHSRIIIALPVIDQLDPCRRSSS